jgi:hypothetical protein
VIPFLSIPVYPQLFDYLQNTPPYITRRRTARVGPVVWNNFARKKIARPCAAPRDEVPVPHAYPFGLATVTSTGQGEAASVARHAR